MALEDNIVALTAALNRNSDLLDILTAKAKAGVTVTGAGATAPKDLTDKIAEKIVKEVEKEDAAPVKRSRSTTAVKAAKAPTAKEMADATTKFLDVEAEDEYNARREYLKDTLLPWAGAPKMSEIEESKRQKALDALEAFKAGDDFPLEDEPTPTRRSRDAEDVA